MRRIKFSEFICSRSLICPVVFILLEIFGMILGSLILWFQTGRVAIFNSFILFVVSFWFILSIITYLQFNIMFNISRRQNFLIGKSLLFSYETMIIFLSVVGCSLLLLTPFESYLSVYIIIFYLVKNSIFIILSAIILGLNISGIVSNKTQFYVFVLAVILFLITGLIAMYVKMPFFLMRSLLLLCFPPIYLIFLVLISGKNKNIKS